MGNNDGGLNSVTAYISMNIQRTRHIIDIEYYIRASKSRSRPSSEARFSKIIASVATLQNDTTSALSSFNLDFAIIKLEASKEYKGVGESISSTRKHDVEAGRLHETAQKLGALFDREGSSGSRMLHDV
ncbi:uncharacterized protein Bfra_009686 [Botrytis fragariae]|uniref:Uncharacterized protein n=1 Tax=Botrytis fragariae TaxID=1964551 RepID=A0A8H6EFG6_9HELO|nr:uncharacterized protein Bfra_009686 [Botrytis fragariae]KAF5870302.1 hypothetical protein Bfra_009686 [Botrytis fragariae]